MSDNLDFNAAIASTVYEFSDDHVIDFSRIPPAVLIEAAKRAFSHVLSNEALSKAGTQADKAVAAGEVDADARDAKRDEIANEFRTAYIERFYDGSWGTGRRAASGPRIDGVELEYQRLLAKDTRAWIANKKLAYDKESKTWSWMTASGRQTRTFEQALTGYESNIMNADSRAAMRDQAQAVVDFKKQQAAMKKAAPVAPVEEAMI